MESKNNLFLYLLYSIYDNIVYIYQWKEKFVYLCCENFMYNPCYSLLFVYYWYQVYQLR